MSRIETFENLKELDMRSFFGLSHIYDSSLNNLEKLSVDCYENDVNSIETFITQFKGLKHLQIPNSLNENQLNILFNELPKLKHLIHLDIKIDAKDI